MTHYFVTGIGTEVGKTFASCALLHQHPHYHAIKPVLSGFGASAPEQCDAAQLLGAMQKPATSENLASISPWRFTAPLSPHLAAAQENTQIKPDELIAFCKQQMAVHPHLLIEGVGGLMVPITQNWLVLDWIKVLDVRVILVASSYLGGINHSLLSLHALRHHNLPLHGVVVSQAEAEHDAGLQSTCKSIRAHLPSTVPLVSLPRQAGDAQSPWKNAPSLLSL